MKLTITIKMDNSAFEENSNGCEVTNILQGLTAKIDGMELSAGDHIPLMDSNGNRVGEAKVTK